MWGPGSVGLVIGARLARAGASVSFVCRNPASVEAIERDGVQLEDLANGERLTVPAAARLAADVDADALGDGPVLVCVRQTQTPAVADRLKEIAPANPIVCVQNGIEGVRVFARQFPATLAAVYRQTCTRREAGCATTFGAGRMIVGTGVSAESIAARLRSAGYDVGVSAHIERDQWLKLCVNLMSAPNALIDRDDHAGAEFVEIKTELLAESRSVLRAADVRAESCDGRDRSLEEEIAFQRGALERGTSARPLPLYNQVWTALRSGGPVEADAYHATIVELARTHGIATPVNDAVLAALKLAVRDERGPESFSAREILDSAQG